MTCRHTARWCCPLPVTRPQRRPAWRRQRRTHACRRYSCWDRTSAARRLCTMPWSSSALPAHRRPAGRTAVPPTSCTRVPTRSFIGCSPPSALFQARRRRRFRALSKLSAVTAGELDSLCRSGGGRQAQVGQVDKSQDSRNIGPGKKTPDRYVLGPKINNEERSRF